MPRSTKRIGKSSPRSTLTWGVYPNYAGTGGKGITATALQITDQGTLEFSNVAGTTMSLAMAPSSYVYVIGPSASLAELDKAAKAVFQRIPRRGNQ
jgi:hypothetical protein